MSVNLKKLYDQVTAADAEVERIATDIQALLDGDKIEEATKKQPELEAAKKDRKQLSDLYKSLLPDNDGSGDPAKNFIPTNDPKEPAPAAELRASKAYKDAFFSAMRNGITRKTISQPGNAEKYHILMDALSETGGDPVGEEGGFLNPIDFDGKIHELMRNYTDLAEFATIEPTNTNTGWRAVEQFAASLPLTLMTELDELGNEDEGESPKFNKVDFSIKDYVDFLRVSNAQMNDTPENLMLYLARWFSKKVVLTHNSLILAKINAMTPTAVTDLTKLLGSLKTAFNKTLDPAISVSSNVYTNQSGFDVLDSLVDGTGRPLLKPDPTNETEMRISGRKVIRLSDAHWANLSGPARSRIAIGDLREFVWLFNREPFEFASTNVGGAAWRSNSTEVRGIARMDAQTVDAGAACLLTTVLA